MNRWKESITIADFPQLGEANSHIPLNEAFEKKVRERPVHQNLMVLRARSLGSGARFGLRLAALHSEKEPTR